MAEDTDPLPHSFLDALHAMPLSTAEEQIPDAGVDAKSR